MSNDNSSRNKCANGSSRPPLALIAGPTASGKSDVAVNIALALESMGRRAVIVNADSAQVYADLAVLSARPAPAEMHGVEHRLFGQWDGAQGCSAADWATAAGQVIEELHAQGVIPILVGGTGLYLKTLLDGIAPVPPIDPAVRQEVRALPIEDAYAALSREDPARAAMLAPADASRIARALEVVRSTGRTLAAWQEQRTGGIADRVMLYPAILLPERRALYARCEARFDRMIEGGAIAEVDVLLRRRLDPALPVMRAIGVPELTGYLQGEWSLAEATERGGKATRNYAKRQFTWFRHQPPACWSRYDYQDFNMGDISELLLRDWRLTR